jgi:hypothetical protein
LKVAESDLQAVRLQQHEVLPDLSVASLEAL